MPVTEDSKFRKVVDIILEEEKAKKQEKDAMSTKEKKLISTSPRDFGKHKEESHSKKDRTKIRQAKLLLKLKKKKRRVEVLLIRKIRKPMVLLA